MTEKSQDMAVPQQNQKLEDMGMDPKNWMVDLVNPAFEDPHAFEPNGDYKSNLHHVGWTCTYSVQLKNHASKAIVIRSIEIPCIYETTGVGSMDDSIEVNSKLDLGSKLPVNIPAGGEIMLKLELKRVKSVIDGKSFSPFFVVHFMPEKSLEFHHYGGFVH